MAITIQDRDGTYGRKRKAEGPPLDKRSARYFAVVNNVWSKGSPTRKATEQVERKMMNDADRGVSFSGSALTLRGCCREVDDGETGLRTYSVG